MSIARINYSIRYLYKVEVPELACSTRCIFMVSSRSRVNALELVTNALLPRTVDNSRVIVTTLGQSYVPEGILISKSY